MTIAALLLIVGIMIIYYLDEERDYSIVVGLCLAALLVMGMIIGEDLPKSSKKKIEPKIKIECLNNKCDTTFIYE